MLAMAECNSDTILFTVHLNLTGKAGLGYVDPVRVSNAKKFVKECYYRKAWSRNAFTRQDKRVNDTGTVVVVVESHLGSNLPGLRSGQSV